MSEITGLPNFTSSDRYRLSFSGNYFFDSKFELIVTSTNLPGLIAGVVEVPTPMRPIPRPGGSILFDDLIVTFNISETYAEWIEIFNWIKANNHMSEVEMSENWSQGQLFITTNKHNPTIVFEMQNVFPYMLSAVDLTTTSPSNDTLSATASFRFHDYKIVSL